MGRYAVLSLLACLLFTAPVHAQSLRAQPYDAQLRTDPGVGNVQGIQRYGRPLRTDPDEGTGFSYHVYPVADGRGTRVAQFPSFEIQRAVNEVRRSEDNLKRARRDGNEENQRSAERDQDIALRRLEDFSLRGAAVGSAPFFRDFGTPYAEPFDATRGLRNFSMPDAAPGLLNDPASVRGLIAAEAMGIGVGEKGIKQLVTLYHQPLIQIKMRVVEVVRDDSFRANSILEYVSQAPNNKSLTSGFPANNGFQNFQGISTFTQTGLATAADKGAGLLLNLTSKHINWVAQLLATEFNADVVTAPEVVTLNGQNVEFVSGQKVPFELGQNVIQGTNNNIQQFFYKNIGTYVSVTPKIVNWGFHGEGKGEAAIVASEIANWNLLATLMLDPRYFSIGDTLRRDLATNSYNVKGRPIPFDLRSRMLEALNQYKRSDILRLEVGNDGKPTPAIRGIYDAIRPSSEYECASCDWKPEDCTVDLAVVVRLSDKGTQDITTTTEDKLETKSLNFEQNVRAVANVIQIKSGHGVVMAGLIGNRELDQIAKTPVLGDIPWLGFLFRSKQTLREKTEVLIFLEARVLDPRPEVARAQSSNDFLLGQPFVHGEFLDNPLEIGMHRIGFGSYLPPAHPGEGIYWERNHRKLRKIATHFDDFKE